MRAQSYKKTLFFLCILGGCFVFANGQSPSRTPTPAEATQRIIRPSNIPNPDILKDLSNDSPAVQFRSLAATTRRPAFRKPTKEDLLLVAPDSEDAEKYADFLRQPKTGLIRLLSDAGCQESANLVVASDFCIKYKNIFGGSVYSFRRENYVMGRFGDIAYKNGTIYSLGKNTLGIFTDLGENVSLAEFSANTNGAKYIYDFVPPDSLPKIEAFLEQLQKGIESSGFKYQRFHGLKENHTYLLRSVAYRRKTQRERGKMIYDELSDDERKDIIVAVQVVRFGDRDKSDVTLLWKELERKDAPRIIISGK